MFWAKKDSGASWYVDIGLEPGLGVSSGSYVKLAAEEKKKKNLFGTSLWQMISTIILISQRDLKQKDTPWEYHR